MLVTGIGKIEAATAVAAVLARGVHPSEIVNLGTAGALRPDLSRIFVAGAVLQHDLDTEAIHEMTGEWYGAPIELGDGPAVATGDVFVTDDAVRDDLAERASLVDMEGYAVAHAARSAGVPVRLVKYVSDDADGDAEGSWTDSVAVGARALAEWSAENIPHYA